MFFTIGVKKWSIAIIVAVLTFIVVCISVSATRYFDKKLCRNQNNISTSKSLESSKSTNSNNLTDAVGNYAKQNADESLIKNNNAKPSFESVNAVKNDIKEYIKNNTSSHQGEGQQVKANITTAVDNKGQTGSVLEPETMIDAKTKKDKENIKHAPIINIKNVYNNDKAKTRNDIIVNIQLVKDKNNNTAKKGAKSSTKKVVKKRSIKKKQMIKKNEAKVERKIVKDNSDKEKIAEKNSDTTKNIVSSNDKVDDIKPKTIQEVVKPERQCDKEAQRQNSPEKDLNNEDVTEVYNTIIVGEDVDE